MNIAPQSLNGITSAPGLTSSPFANAFASAADLLLSGFST
ncbi:hypothetical protein SSYIS1_03710 [Serratia symbiotica]|uniref:Uncharacterized protein n=1 Tax=Serratia symbiotica TaxID=138074 RepID=A0A455VKN7_9GAMM|nr:hypothetical protein SSYIS1_03710 [Serratia symbiotica]